MPRSPLTEPLLRVQGMIAYVRENLSTDEYMLFLDLLAPEPEPQKPAGKKSSPSKSSQPSSKSTRASGMAAQLGQRRKRGQSDDSVNTEGLCAFQCHDETFCDEPYLNRIHAADGGYAGYHPFQPPAPPAPTASPANGGAGSTIQSLEASAVSAGAATGGSSE